MNNAKVLHAKYLDSLRQKKIQLEKRIIQRKKCFLIYNFLKFNSSDVFLCIKSLNSNHTN